MILLPIIRHHPCHRRRSNKRCRVLPALPRLHHCYVRLPLRAHKAPVSPRTTKSVLMTVRVLDKQGLVSVENASQSHIVVKFLLFDSHLRPRQGQLQSAGQSPIPHPRRRSCPTILGGQVENGQVRCPVRHIGLRPRPWGSLCQAKPRRDWFDVVRNRRRNAPRKGWPYHETGHCGLGEKEKETVIG